MFVLVSQHFPVLALYKISRQIHTNRFLFAESTVDSKTLTQAALWKNKGQRDRGKDRQRGEPPLRWDPQVYFSRGSLQHTWR